MPATTIPFVPHYDLPPATQASLDYADLPIIDISKADTVEGRAALAVQSDRAMREHGFMYVVGHGYPEEKIQRIFDIANVPFEYTGEQEKQVYAGKMLTTGSYQGYKLRRYWHIDNGVHDQLEHYNINRDVKKKEHPSSLRPLLPEIEAFAKFNHGILHVILRLLALGLGLREETFVDIHGYDAVGETYVRFMKYYPRSEEEEEKTSNVWLKGHTDFGSITILWSQPIAALQILSKSGQWKWVRHIPNALVINAGDALSFLTGGRYAGTVHRVVRPPPDQANYTRVGVFYFAMPDDNVVLEELEELKKLRRIEGMETENLEEKEKGKPAPTMEQWRRGRTAAYGKSSLTRAENGVEVEEIAGVVVKHYN